MEIPMVDLLGQYLKIKDEIDAALQNCLNHTNFIQGPEVQRFEKQLAAYLDVKRVIGCGNGTDALQIALMALELKPGDEVIVPAFTYIAAVEALVLLGLTPVFVDVEADSFNLSVPELEKAIGPKTKAIVPVHLFGQSANMEALMKLAGRYSLMVIEDNAQSMGASFTCASGETKKTGAIGHINTHSFFPTKNLSCFGDGGALSTNDEKLAEKCRSIASHGQKRKYQHEVVGCNSRLDTLQAAVLLVKLKYLDVFIRARQQAAERYALLLKDIPGIELPKLKEGFVHTFNQFTLKISNGKRDQLQLFLKEQGIPSIVYYPLPVYRQKAYSKYVPEGFECKNTEELCRSVLSLPMHTELTPETQERIAGAVRKCMEQ